MFGSGLNLVSAALGFGMTAAFAAFVCARFICCRERRGDTRAPPSPDFAAELDGPENCVALYQEANRGTGAPIQIEYTRTGLEPLVIAAIPTMKYNCEAFSSKDDVQCSICLGEYKEREILRIVPTCRHSFHLACLDLWLQKQTTCPICRVSLKELQAGMPSARSIQQLPADPENSDNPAPQHFLPARQDHRGQNNSHETRESVEVVIEIVR